MCPQLPDWRIHRRWSQSLLGGAQQQEDRQWTQVGIWEVPIRKKKKFTMKVVKYWNRLPKEVVVSPSLGGAQGPEQPDLIRRVLSRRLD